ncbi:MAG: hypothetical protein ABMA64_41375 [Myxococcota bacterium]
MRPWARVADGTRSGWVSDLGAWLAESEPGRTVDHVYAVDLAGALVHAPTEPMLFALTLSTNLWLPEVLDPEGRLRIEQGPWAAEGAVRFNAFLTAVRSAASGHGGSMHLGECSPPYRYMLGDAGIGVAH